MLKLSAKTEYALLLVKYLLGTPGISSIANIGTELHIPEAVLRKVVQKLVIGGICASEKGRLGGIYLQKKDITLYMVLAAMGENMDVVLCAQKTKNGHCDHEVGCSISPILKRLQKGMEALLKITKL